jgi:hypothetical protein
MDQRIAEELDAKTGRAAIVHLQNGTAAVGKELHLRVIVFPIPVPRTFMVRRTKGSFFGFAPGGLVR